MKRFVEIVIAYSSERYRSAIATAGDRYVSDAEQLIAKAAGELGASRLEPLVLVEPDLPSANGVAEAIFNEAIERVKRDGLNLSLIRVY